MRAVQQNEGRVLRGEIKIADDVLEYQSARARIGPVVVVGDESRKQCARSRVALNVVRHALLRGVVCKAVARQQVNINGARAAGCFYHPDGDIAAGSPAAAQCVAVGEVNADIRGRINAHRDYQSRLLRVALIRIVRGDYRGGVRARGVGVKVGVESAHAAGGSVYGERTFNAKDVPPVAVLPIAAGAARGGESQYRVGDGARDKLQCLKARAGDGRHRQRARKVNRQRARHRPCVIISDNGHRNQARASAECAQLAAADNEVRARLRIGDD